MLNSALANFIMERMRVMLNLCMRNLYNPEYIETSLLFFDKNESPTFEFFSNTYKIKPSELYEMQEGLIKIFEDENEETRNGKVEKFLLKFFEHPGHENAIIGIYEIYSKIIINLISYKNDDYKYIYRVNNNRHNDIDYPQSLFDALIRTIKYHLHYFEIKEDINECELHYNPTTVQSEAAQSFLGIIGASSANTPSLDLLGSINNLSNLTYENKKPSGEIIFSKVENFHYDVKLKNPIEIKQGRRIRKLLEICSESHFLLSDGHSIYGIGTVGDGVETYILDVYDIGCWQMSHSGKLLLRSEFGKISVAQRYISNIVLAKKIRGIFGDCDTIKISKLIYSMLKAEHGSIIVISEGAHTESDRLCIHGFLPEPFEPNLDLLNQLSKIDGAVILDQNLYCHGFGVILDGVSVQSQDPSRGSRYNSSLRYYYYIKEKFEKTLIVVTSDDGMVDFIPQIT